MVSREQWCAEKLAKLLNEDLRISALNEIKEHLQEVDNHEAAQTAGLLELPLVFDCLNNSNEEQVDLACEVLSLCMNKLDISETATRYTIPLERALTHPNTGVQQMALNEILRIAQGAPNGILSTILDTGNLFLNVIFCIGSDNLRVATTASSIATIIFTNLPQCTNEQRVLTAIKTTMQKNEVVRLRIYELLINVAKHSVELYQAVNRTGLLHRVVEELDSKDVLLRLNIIEMLYALVETRYGYDYLDSQGFIIKLFKQYLEDDDPMFTSLCEAGIIKFFGHMAHSKPLDAILNYPAVLEKIFNCITESNHITTKVCLETLAYIAMADKVVLDSKVGCKMVKTAEYLGANIQQFPTEGKIVALNWLSEILRGNMDEANSSVAHKWFNSFCENTMDIVMHYVRNPFEEMRLAGLQVLHSLTLHKWGQEYIKQYPGLPEYLVDRNAETSKQVKDLKYDIVKAIVENNLAGFNNNVINMFKTYVNEGAHYVPAVTEVAIEGLE